MFLDIIFLFQLYDESARKSHWKTQFPLKLFGFSVHYVVVPSLATSTFNYNFVCETKKNYTEQNDTKPISDGKWPFQQRIIYSSSECYSSSKVRHCITAAPSKQKIIIREI